MAFQVETLIAQGVFPDTPAFRALGRPLAAAPEGADSAPPFDAIEALVQSGGDFGALPEVLRQMEHAGQTAAEGAKREIQAGLTAAQSTLAQVAQKAKTGGGVDVHPVSYTHLTLPTKRIV